MIPRNFQKTCLVVRYIKLQIILPPLENSTTGSYNNFAPAPENSIWLRPRFRSEEKLSSTYTFKRCRDTCISHKKPKKTKKHFWTKRVCKRHVPVNGCFHRMWNIGQVWQRAAFPDGSDCALRLERILIDGSVFQKFLLRRF